MIAKNVLICLIASASLLPAQSDRGRISGSAYDPSGAAIPRAIVQIVNPQTSAIRRLGAGEGRMLDLYLEPASVKQAISVVADSDSQVQTHTASIAATIGEEPVQNRRSMAA